VRVRVRGRCGGFGDDLAVRDMCFRCLRLRASSCLKLERGQLSIYWVPSFLSLSTIQFLQVANISIITTFSLASTTNKKQPQLWTAKTSRAACKVAKEAATVIAATAEDSPAVMEEAMTSKDNPADMEEAMTSKDNLADTEEAMTSKDNLADMEEAMTSKDNPAEMEEAMASKDNPVGMEEVTISRVEVRNLAEVVVWSPTLSRRECRLLRDSPRRRVGRYYVLPLIFILLKDADYDCPKAEGKIIVNSG